MPVKPSPLSTLRLKTPRNAFYGWRIVGTTVVALAVIGASTFQSLGVFFVALERSFGWSRTVLSGAFTLSRAEGAFLGPLEGILTDRLGSRRMILIGMGIAGAGFLLFSMVQSVIAFYIAFLIIFTGAGLGGWLPLMTAINNWFVRNRTKAMAIGMSGFNVGGLLVPLLAWAVTTYGWRITTVGLAVITWAMAIPLYLLVRNRPEDYGQHPDGDPSPAGQGDGALTAELPIPGEINFTLGQAIRTRAFWLIAVSHTLSVASFATIAVHIVPALTDRELSLTLAATVVATYTFTGALFQIVGGFLGDRFPKPPLIAAFIIIQGVGMLLAATMHSTLVIFLFAITFGIGFGGRTPLLTAIRGDYFGRQYFATILGTSQIVINLGTMAAPLLAGYIYDKVGSYNIAFLGLAVLNLLGALAILPARKPTLPAPRH